MLKLSVEQTRAATEALVEIEKIDHLRWKSATHRTLVVSDVHISLHTPLGALMAGRVLDARRQELVEVLEKLGLAVDDPVPPLTCIDDFLPEYHDDFLARGLITPDEREMLRKRNSK